MLFDEKTYLERLEHLSPVLFNNSTNVEIIESSTSAERATKIQLQDEATLAEQLSKQPNPTLRIM